MFVCVGVCVYVWVLCVGVMCKIYILYRILMPLDSKRSDAALLKHI